ncbi:MAG: sugar ABC transporter permease [Agathobacter sp.]|nr:sugar ABC transporter permease [Agathobacter sp.]
MTKTGVAKKKKDYNRWGYLFVLPFVIVFLVFSIYPVLRTLYLSFTSYKGYGDAVWIGIDNYIRVFKDRFFWRDLWNTVKIWGVNIILQIGLAFLLTIIFSDIKYKVKGLSVFRAVFYLPNLIAATSVAFLFKTLLDWKYGTFNQMLMTLGLTDQQINWMGTVSTAPWVISIIQTWMWFGNSFIVLMAAVQGINPDYFEAAAIDGAGRWTVFRKITLPLIRPILLYVLITSLIGGLQLFDLPFLMNGVAPGTAGEPSGALQTAVMYLYKFGFETRQVGYASAIAYTLFFIILIVSIIQFKTIGKEEE